MKKEIEKNKLPPLSGGFVPQLPEIDDYELGGETKIRGEILRSNGDWEEVLPIHEMQKKRYFDTFGCVSFSSLNCYEAIHKLKYGFEINWSDRATIVASGTKPGRGNSLKAVVESIRKDGVIAEEKYPYPEDIKLNEFYAPLSKGIKDEMEDNLSEFRFGYEWVDKSLKRPMSRDKLCEALKYSPLITAVDSRSTRRVRAYDHCEKIFKYKYKDWIRTYNPYQHKIKQYPWDYNFFPPIIGYLDRLKDRDITSARPDIFTIRHRKKSRVAIVNSDNNLLIFPSEEVFKKVLGVKEWNHWVDVSEEEWSKFKDVGAIDTRLNDVLETMRRKEIIK